MNFLNEIKEPALFSFIGNNKSNVLLSLPHQPELWATIWYSYKRQLLITGKHTSHHTLRGVCILSTAPKLNCPTTNIPPNTCHEIILFLMDLAVLSYVIYIFFIRVEVEIFKEEFLWMSFLALHLQRGWGWSKEDGQWWNSCRNGLPRKGLRTGQHTCKNLVNTN